MVRGEHGFLRKTPGWNVGKQLNHYNYTLISCIVKRITLESYLRTVQLRNSQLMLGSIKIM